MDLPVLVTHVATHVEDEVDSIYNGLGDLAGGAESGDDCVVGLNSPVLAIKGLRGTRVVRGITGPDHLDHAVTGFEVHFDSVVWETKPCTFGVSVFGVSSSSVEPTAGTVDKAEQAKGIRGSIEVSMGNIDKFISRDDVVGTKAILAPGVEKPTR